MEGRYANKRECIDYWSRAFREAPDPRLFPIARVITPLVVSGANFFASYFRHRANPRSQLPVAREVLIFAVITLVVYMVLYACEWSWNSLVISPATLDRQVRGQTAERDNQIAALKETISSARKERQQGEQFAELMGRGRILSEAFSCAPDNATFNARVPDLLRWVGDTVAALQESGFLTDAMAFSDSGTIPPSQAQVSAFNHLQDWKRYQVAQLSMYRQKLHEIVERRGL